MGQTGDTYSGKSDTYISRARVETRCLFIFYLFFFFFFMRNYAGAMLSLNSWSNLLRLPRASMLCDYSVIWLKSKSAVATQFYKQQSEVGEMGAAGGLS